MSAAEEMLKPAEAAVVAGVAIRDVNRAIDERILPESFLSLDGAGRRRIAATACAFIAFYFESAGRLTAEERLFAIRQAESRFHWSRARALSSPIAEDWVVRHEFLTIDFGPFVRRTEKRMDRLSAAQKMVVCDPEILAGTPIIRGTRVPVHDVAASIAAGFPLRRILAAYPSLDEERIELAAIYCEANPLRGRPRSSGELARNANLVTDRHAPRRSKRG